MQSDTEELQLTQKVFELCSAIKSNDIQKLIRSTKLNEVDASSKIVTPTLVIASNKFVKNLSEQLIVQYCALSEVIASKQQVSAA